MENKRQFVPPKLQEIVRAAEQLRKSATADPQTVLMLPADEAKGSVHLQCRQDRSGQEKLSR